MHFQISFKDTFSITLLTSLSMEKNLRPHTLMIGQRASCILVYLYPMVAHALFSTRYSISSFLVPIPNVPVHAQLLIAIPDARFFGSISQSGGDSNSYG